MTDWTAVFKDINTRELTAEYRRAVAAAIPGGVNVPAIFWTELADAAADYFGPPDEDERPRNFILEAMEDIGKSIDRLSEEVGLIRYMQLEPLDALIDLLPALGRAKAEAELHAGRYNRMIAAHRGHNPHRQALYSAVLQLWCHELGQGLVGSAKGGPLVRFFTACVGPILGAATPKAAAIAKIKEREQLRYLGRAGTKSKAKN